MGDGGLESFSFFYSFFVLESVSNENEQKKEERE
jgi:hypothetical protein